MNEPCPTCRRELPDTLVNVNLDHNVIAIAGKSVQLTKCEAELCHALWNASPRTLTRGQLLDMIHGHNADMLTEQSIDVMICKIRVKLTRFPVLIHTSYGRGWWWENKR